MALRKWGTVRAGSQLVEAANEMVQLYGDSAPNALLETLDLALSELVRGYGDVAGDFAVYWPGIASGVLTINDVSSGHRFLVTGGVLVLDDGAARANAAIRTTDNVLMVTP